MANRKNNAPIATTKSGKEAYDTRRLSTNQSSGDKRASNARGLKGASANSFNEKRTKMYNDLYFYPNGEPRQVRGVDQTSGRAYRANRQQVNAAIEGVTGGSNARRVR